ncbi:MAG TPA: hypothetical protein VE781_10900 [Kineosporiaceae bacterium]|jgi:hypothetical protein|nr:hypothetical protein [Kineosporiaceae bacterium]
MTGPDAATRGARQSWSRVVGVACLALAGATALSGCSGSASSSSSAPITTAATIGGSSASPSSSPSATTGDQQAQAYAAAVSTYKQYWQQLLTIINKRRDATELRGISRGEAFSYGLSVAREAQIAGYTVDGPIKDVYLRPVKFTYGGSTKNPSNVTLQACQDLSTGHLLDSKGRQVPKDPKGPKFLRLDLTVTNFTPSVTNEWQLDDFKTTPVASCS